MSNKWHEIWEKRSENADILSGGNPKEIFMELKRIAGWDIKEDGISYEAFYEQYISVKNEFESDCKAHDGRLKSVFEVGCGCGANLYLFQNDGMEVGGIDFSNTMCNIAKKVLINPRELICDEADKLPADKKYDAVMSNSVFSYFSGYEYASKVLEAMYDKANYSMGILDVGDADKKDAFVEYRKIIIKDFEERYKDLPKFFYDKSFFADFADRHNMNIRFSEEKMKDYWNNDFIFNCYMTKK